MLSRVYGIKVKNESVDDIFNAIQQLMKLQGKLNIASGEKVAIKLNLCAFRPYETGATSDPRVVETFIRYLIEQYNPKIVLVEADAAQNASNLFKWLGFQRLLNIHHVTFVNLSKDELIEKKIDGYFFKKVLVPHTIYAADYFISLPKLKSHVDVKISCALKNQFGALPSPKKYKYHPHLEDVIVDANLAMKPDLILVDGIIAMEGLGPLYGFPRKCGILLSGNDPVAIDTLCAKILNQNPFFVNYLRKARKKGLGTSNYKLVGLELADIPRLNVKSYSISKFFLRIANKMIQFAQSVRGI